MNKTLRIGMGKAFETAICRRWPGFALNKSIKIFPKNSGELFLTWKPCPDLELVFSIYPHQKADRSCFMISFAWSRTGNFEFTPSRGTLGSRPPDYDIRKALRSGLTLEKADICMDDLWTADWGIKENRSKQTFKNFDDKYWYPSFPLKSPLFTFDPVTQGPEDYQRLQAAEQALTLDDAIGLATPVIEEICDHIAMHIWPFVEEELIPFTSITPFASKEAPQ